jgi:CheY-like chemotaxis protein
MAGSEVWEVKRTVYEEFMDVGFRRQPDDGRWFGPSMRVRGNGVFIQGSHPHGRDGEPAKQFIDMNPPPQFVHAEPLRDVQPDLRDASRQCPPATNPAGVNQVAVPPKRSLRVLCIDDDEQILESMKDCLAYFDHRVKAASGGKYGIELFCTSILKSEPYDVVIVDLSMPDVNGCEVARKIKAESPNTPVVMMTGGDTTTKEAGLMSGSVDVVVKKPPHIQELNDLLLRITRRA